VESVLLDALLGLLLAGHLAVEAMRDMAESLARGHLSAELVELVEPDVGRRVVRSRDLQHFVLL
jgi:hypothetical protein